MTESEWLACTDPTPMLDFLLGNPSERRLRKKAIQRKLRLFALACCWRVWHLLTDDRSRRAVETLERHVEKRATETELRATWHDAMSAENELHAASAPMAIVNAASVAAYAQDSATATAVAAAGAVAFAKSENARPGTLDRNERTAQSALLRDVFGNPFRPSPPLPPAVL